MQLATGNQETSYRLSLRDFLFETRQLFFNSRNMFLRITPRFARVGVVFRPVATRTNYRIASFSVSASKREGFSTRHENDAKVRSFFSLPNCPTYFIFPRVILPVSLYEEEILCDFLHMECCSNDGYEGERKSTRLADRGGNYYHCHNLCRHIYLKAISFL